MVVNKDLLAQPVKMEITPHRAEGDPPFRFWRVVITNESGVWTEAFGSLEHLCTFIRGFQAAHAMFGSYFSFPEVPKFSD